jgi:hypothetical protein
MWKVEGVRLEFVDIPNAAFANVKKLAVKLFVALYAQARQEFK